MSEYENQQWLVRLTLIAILFSLSLAFFLVSLLSSSSFSHSYSRDLSCLFLLNCKGTNRERERDREGKRASRTLFSFLILVSACGD